MKFPHAVKYNGKIYPANTEIKVKQAVVEKSVENVEKPKKAPAKKKDDE